MDHHAEAGGYAVFLFPQAIEALGEAIKPFLFDSPMGSHIPCRELDTGGNLVQLRVQARGSDGQEREMTLLIPGSMIRLVVSRTTSPQFGFAPRGNPPPLPDPGQGTDEDADRD